MLLIIKDSAIGVDIYGSKLKLRYIEEIEIELDQSVTGTNLQ